MSTDGDSFLGQPKAKIMLLGTFHLDNPGLDRHKPKYDFDVFSERRQREIEEVVERLASFQPTKITVEIRLEHQEETDRLYSAYLRGEFQLPASERYQLGFRLAKRLGHSKVYCIDVWGRYYDPPIDIEAYVREHGLDRGYLENLLSPCAPEAYARKHGQEHLLSQWWPRFEKQFEQEDMLVSQLTLRENLLCGNSEDHILKGHGAYLVDWFKVGMGNEYPGVDWVTAWYNRNLRIFANLQRITKSQDERILLIIGSGHLPILRHCVLASPEYELVEVCKYLEVGDGG